MQEMCAYSISQVSWLSEASTETLTGFPITYLHPEFFNVQFNIWFNKTYTFSMKAAKKCKQCDILYIHIADMSEL